MEASEDDQKEVPTSTSEHDDVGSDSWTATAIVISILLFLAAGVAEIGGGWLVWQAVRGDPPRPKGLPRWAIALIGSAVLVVYGFLPTFQPLAASDSFGRIYAVYGGFFIVMSFLAGWALDGSVPDVGDYVGGGLALIGVLLVLFWPRNK